MKPILKLFFLRHLFLILAVGAFLIGARLLGPLVGGSAQQALNWLLAVWLLAVLMPLARTRNSLRFRTLTLATCLPYIGLLLLMMSYSAWVRVISGCVFAAGTLLIVGQEIVFGYDRWFGLVKDGKGQLVVDYLGGREVRQRIRDGEIQAIAVMNVPLGGFIRSAFLGIFEKNEVHSPAKPVNMCGYVLRRMWLGYGTVELLDAFGGAIRCALGRKLKDGKPGWEIYPLPYNVHGKAVLAAILMSSSVVGFAVNSLDRIRKSGAEVTAAFRSSREMWKLRLRTARVLARAYAAAAPIPHASEQLMCQLRSLDIDKGELARIVARAKKDELLAKAASSMGKVGLA